MKAFGLLGHYTYLNRFFLVNLNNFTFLGFKVLAFRDRGRTISSKRATEIGEKEF